MKILSKSGDRIEFLASPAEDGLRRGDYLLVSENGRKLLVQVIDIEYAELPGMLEDTLRELASESVSLKSFDPFRVGSLLMDLKDSRLVIGKFRGAIEDGSLRNDLLWLPSRLSSRIEKASPELLEELSGSRGRRPIRVGECMGGGIMISAEDLDGRLTIIIGKKETGKSHLAKLLITALAEYGARIVVLDVNGEYLALSKRIDGSRSEIAEKHLVLTPGKNFKVSIEDAGLKTILDILQHIRNTPANSLREFVRIWKLVKKVEGKITLKGLIDALSRVQIHESIREALLSRLLSLEEIGFFDEESAIRLEDLLNSLRDGGIVVINLSRSLAHGRRIVVEYLLSRLSALLTRGAIDPIFLLAEEAHLYLRETYWEDLVTRMRHIGLFPILITNQPNCIPESVYRQADNVFLFNFTNEVDLNYISKISRVDSETAKRIAKALPPRHCLIVGKAVNDLPIVVKVDQIPLMTMGETKLLFKLR